MQVRALFNALRQTECPVPPLSRAFGLSLLVGERYDCADVYAMWSGIVDTSGERRVSCAVRLPAGGMGRGNGVSATELVALSAFILILAACEYALARWVFR